MPRIDEDSRSILSWTVHLARRDTVRATAVAVFITALSLFSGAVLGSPLISLLAFIVLILSLSPFFFPVHYSIDENGISLRILFHTRTRPWSDFKRWESDGKSVKLFTMENRSRLDNYRGILIQLEPGTREIVLDQLRRFLP